MRPNAETNAFAARMMDRAIPPSLYAPYHNDPPSRISYAFGGREWFFEQDARSVHRIGIFLGLGWRLPKYVQRPDGIDMVKIIAETVGFGMEESLTIQLLHCGEQDPEWAEEIKVAHHVPYRSLKQVYEEMLA